MKSVSVFGLGYVGAVTAACLADAGHSVIGVDVNPAKVASLEAGRTPVLEPGLEELIKSSREAGRLKATVDSDFAVLNSDISFVCVGTPSRRNGQLDTTILERSCKEIGRALRKKAGFHYVVVRSTVLPGTAESLVIPALEGASGKRAGVDFAVCSHPEFTREGSAVRDFWEPAITVFGAQQAEHFQCLHEVYGQIPGRVFETTLRVAEMVKYVCNAFHALKVTFANEIGSLCEALAVDAGTVTNIFLADTKLNVSSAYLKPGFAFGGSCLPKDLRALNYRAKQADLDLPLLASIAPSNDAHLERAVEAVLGTKRKKVGVLGLSFKAGTDDLRESPSVQLIKRLLGEGRQVRIWDQEVSLGRVVGSNRQFIEDEIPHIGLLLSTDLDEVLRSVEVIVIGTKAIDDSTLAASLRADQVIVDLRSAALTPKYATKNSEVTLAAEQGSAVPASFGALVLDAA